jgi:hypothetical protein
MVTMVPESGRRDVRRSKGVDMMKAISRGSCAQCTKPVVYLKYNDNDEVIVVVACPHCKIDIHFDLETLYSALVGEEPQNFEKILRDFKPLGLPN